MKDNNSSLDLALHDTIPIGTVRVVVDQCERIIFAAGVVDLEERNLCVVDRWQICADGISSILLSEYGSAAAQQKERGQKLHYRKRLDVLIESTT